MTTVSSKLRTGNCTVFATDFYAPFEHARVLNTGPLSYSTDACVLFSMAKGLVFKRMRDFNRTTDLKIPVQEIALSLQLILSAVWACACFEYKTLV